MGDDVFRARVRPDGKLEVITAGDVKRIEHADFATPFVTLHRDEDSVWSICNGVQTYEVDAYKWLFVRRRHVCAHHIETRWVNGRPMSQRPLTLKVKT